MRFKEWPASLVAPLLQLDDTKYVSVLRELHGAFVGPLPSFHISLCVAKSSIDGKHANN
jgi:hypothetical protein